MAENKLPVAVVTGVGPGLGAALARRFAKGYAVAINARKPDFIAAVAKEIRGEGGRVLEVVGDIGDPARTRCCSTMPAAAPGARSSISRPRSMRAIGASMRWARSSAPGK